MNCCNYIGEEIDSAPDKKWQKELVERITDLERIEVVLNLKNDEKTAIASQKIAPPFAITNHYAKLIGSLGENHPLRKTMIPQIDELSDSLDEFSDPLGEENHSPIPGLVHTYPDKVLFLATTFCSAYCRYCTRSRMTGKNEKFAPLSERINYIREHTEIRDVLISGGDPLTLPDSEIDKLLGELRAIPHIRLIRIGTKTPVVLPSRFTENLCKILRKHNVWLSLHFIHADELCQETRDACLRISDFGIPMVSQTVLLKGVNDSFEAIRDLMYALLEVHVKPYYLLQCDPVYGTRHFRTSVEKGIEIVNALHGNVSGLAVPQFVVDAPGGGGKVPLLSTKQIERCGNKTRLINYLGDQYSYPEM